MSSVTQMSLIISLSGALNCLYVLYFPLGVKVGHSRLSLPGVCSAWLQSSYHRAISTSSALMYFSEQVKRSTGDVVLLLKIRLIQLSR